MLRLSVRVSFETLTFLVSLSECLFELFRSGLGCFQVFTCYRWDDVVNAGLPILCGISPQRGICHLAVSVGGKELLTGFIDHCLDG